MNKLSWFLYLADILANIQTFLVLLSITLVAAMVVSWFARMISEGEFVALTKVKSLYLIILFSAFVATLIPSNRTMYMIAASESAEMVVTNPVVKETFGDLVKLIQKKLKGETNE